MIKIETIVAAADRLGAFPQTAVRLAAVVADNDSTVDDVVEAVRYDQGLTADILKYANSAAAASARAIETVRDAVIRLGGGRILTRMIGRYVKKDMMRPLAVYGYNEQDLWRHSVAAAVAAEALGSVASPRGGGLSFTAALLHDIGKLLLGRMAPREDMEKIWALVSEPESGVDCAQAEQRVLGFSHADVGAAVIAAWGLPEPLGRAIRDHHAAAILPADPITDVVCIANVAARSIGEGIGSEGMAVAVDSASAERCGLSREKFEKLCAATAGRLSEVLAAYEV